MASGPSKEELKNYWETSRQYFDELARHYKTADPDYYEEYIAPFYRNPLTSIQARKGSSSPVVSVIAVIALLIMGLVVGAVFFLLNTQSDNETIEEKPKIEKKVDSEEKFEKIDTMKTKSTEKRKNRNRTQPIERVR
jgi:hypothetical protein